MRDGTIEIITGRERRRRWGTSEMLRIVLESHESGTRVCDVGSLHGKPSWEAFGWRVGDKSG